MQPSPRHPPNERKDHNKKYNDPKQESAAVDRTLALLLLRRKLGCALGGFLWRQFDLRRNGVDTRVERAGNVAGLEFGRHHRTGDNA